MLLRETESFPDKSLGLRFIAARHRPDYQPLPGSEGIFIHRGMFTATNELATAAFTGYDSLKPDLQDVVQRVNPEPEIARRAATEQQMGWEFAAVSSDTACKLGVPAVYQTVSVPQNDQTQERGL